MLFVDLTVFAIAACQQLTGLDQRLSTTECVNVDASIFQSCQPSNDVQPQGGAIYCSSQDQSSVTRSEFIACSAVGNSKSQVAKGGALYFDGRIALDRCCATDCASDNFGSFAYFTTTVRCDVNASSILSAKVPSTGSGGTFYLQQSTRSLSSVNFTQCDVAQAGAAFWCPWGASPGFDAAFLTVVSSSGESAIESYCEEEQTVTQSNFYDNAATVLAEYSALGMKVTSCIFRGNYAICFMNDAVTDVSQQFQFTDCVFSGSLPSSSNGVTLIGTGNHGTMVTASWDIAVDERACDPRISITSSTFVVEGPSVSRQFTDSAAFSRSVTSTDSSALPPSYVLPLSPALRHSLAIIPSDTGIETAALLSSTNLAPSKVLGVLSSAVLSVSAFLESVICADSLALFLSAPLARSYVLPLSPALRHSLAIIPSDTGIETAALLSSTNLAPSKVLGVFSSAVFSVSAFLESVICADSLALFLSAPLARSSVPSRSADPARSDSFDDSSPCNLSADGPDSFFGPDFSDFAAFATAAPSESGNSPQTVFSSFLSSDSSRALGSPASPQFQITVLTSSALPTSSPLSSDAISVAPITHSLSIVLMSPLTSTEFTLSDSAPSSAPASASADSALLVGGIVGGLLVLVALVCLGLWRFRASIIEYSYYSHSPSSLPNTVSWMASMDDGFTTLDNPMDGDELGDELSAEDIVVE
jgi:hypothetical protein